MRCPSCGREGAPLAKFCSECGAALGPGRRAGPGAARMEEELRQLTVLFCDLVGSTELSTRMDAEDFGELIQMYLARTAEVIHEYEGDVARYLGDGILAQFGWPEAHDDDASRAVRAGLSLVAGIEAMNRELAPDTQLAVRIGIHTGPAMVGRIRASRHQESISLGETLNVAARLQMVAPRNGVVLSNATRDLVRGMFVLEDLPPQVLRAFRQPVEACLVVGPTGCPRPARRAVGGTHAADRSRQAELSALRELWLRAAGGSGHAALVVGEPGVGKSRLVHELRRELQAEPHSWLECRCSSYTRQSAFRPVAELLEQALELRSGDPSGQTLGKIERWLGCPRPRRGERGGPACAPALGRASADTPAPLGMSAELRRKRTIELLADWCRGARPAASDGVRRGGRSLVRSVLGRALRRADLAQRRDQHAARDDGQAGVHPALAGRRRLDRRAGRCACPSTRRDG